MGLMRHSRGMDETFLDLEGGMTANSLLCARCYPHCPIQHLQ